MMALTASGGTAEVHGIKTALQYSANVSHPNLCAARNKRKPQLPCHKPASEIMVHSKS
jgi:hypothetical protein